jgi:hypothetical protein
MEESRANQLQQEYDMKKLAQGYLQPAAEWLALDSCVLAFGMCCRSNKAILGSFSKTRTRSQDGEA